MNSLLQIEGLSKRYGSTIALDDINLTLETTRATGLVGKNGAGKTTLLSILSSAIRADRGTVHILGLPLSQIPGSGKLNILPQDAAFRPGTSVFRQLVLFARLQGLSKTQANTDVEKLAEELGDGSIMHRKPEQLSYGQRKRLGVVQAFLGSPELVILDEPTAGLDPIVANEVRQLIRKIAGDSAFIISSHNLNEIEDICTDVVILDGGRLVASKPIDELARRQNTLRLTLNRAVENDLLLALQESEFVSSVRQDSLKPEKLSIVLAAGDADSHQLQIQTMIMNRQYVIQDFNRGQGLMDGVMDLVGPTQGTRK